MDDSELPWYELIDRKDEFLEMLKVIHRDDSQKPDPLNRELVEVFNFQAQLIEAPVEKVKIYLKKLQDYEFVIKAKLGNRKEEWLHVDGIKQERHEIIRMETVFHITCVTDLFQPPYCKEVPLL